MHSNESNWLTNAKCVHFIGIGGISMSGLSRILKQSGRKVSGSDRTETHITKELSAAGIPVFIGHNAKHLPEDCDLVVYTAAISMDNPELTAARAKHIHTIERSTLLGLIMRAYQNAICISGTHGKTTTTSMLSVVLMGCGLDPTITVGGELPQIGGNLHLGGQDYFVTEACEYVDSFLKFSPTIAIITNIEEDHLDYFKDIQQIIGSFHAFAAKIPQGGLLVVNQDDTHVLEAVQGITCRRKNYSVRDREADYFAENIHYGHAGCASFDLVVNGRKAVEVNMGVPGIHNVYNALAVFAVCNFLGLSLADCAREIASFSGTKRRFERKGMVRGALLLDDYAHHPTEIAATLSAAEKMQHNEVWCVFQPHTYTRTYTLFNDFIAALSSCDHVIVTDIYAAREKDTGLVHAKQLADALPNAVYLSGFPEIEQYLLDHIQKDDLVITMGAGDIFKVGEDLLRQQHESVGTQASAGKGSDAI